MIIGLGHQARVGKDTIADYLVLEKGFKRLAFADALKNLAYDLNPLMNMYGENLATLVHGAGGWDQAKAKPEVRQFLQRLGVAAREHIAPDVWVRPVLREVFNGGRDYVVTDVRFPNEFEALEEAGAFLVKVHRPGVESNAGSHISETALADAAWHFHLFNNGTFENLYQKVDLFLTEGTR